VRYASGAGAGGGSGGASGAGGSSPDGGVGQACASTPSCPSGLTCTTEDGVCNPPEGCGAGTTCPAVCFGTCRLPTVPPPITFSLQNGGATSVYIYEGCTPDLTITQLSTPPIVIGNPADGCGICDCAQTICPAVVCGARYQGGLEIAAAGGQQYLWSPVDMSYETRGTTQCSHTGILPPGHYRIDAPVYTSNADAVATVYEVAERLRVSVRSAIRYLEALRRAGEPLYDELAGKRKVWKLMPTARQQTLTFTTSQMLSLFLSRRVFDFLEGTGFKEDLDDVFAKLEHTLRRQDAAAARNLDRKIFDVNEAPHLYQGRIEHVGDILTALLKEQRLVVVHESVRGRARFEIDPYTLLVYKKGLYPAGYSHKHEAVCTFALDGFADVEWLKGRGFTHPADYHPSQLYEGAFGLHAGEPLEVRIRFSDKVARYVGRRRWHPSQEVRPVAGGIELTMRVHGTTEVLSWMLGFGKEAEILEPDSLRAAAKAELRSAVERYG